MGWMADETGLGKTAANYTPLSPLSFLKRAARVFPDHPAVIYGAHRKTYAEYHARVTRLASALTKLGVQPGDVVATLIPNLPAQAEAHFGVPACGAILNTINTRLEADTVAYILDHGGAKVLLVDPQFLPMAAEAMERMEGPAPTVIEVAGQSRGRPCPRPLHGIRRPARLGRSRFRLDHAAGRMGKHRAQLHLRHHGPPQGRGLSPSRRLSERHGTGHQLAHDAAPALPDHRAAVSLQRLVPHLDDAGPRRHAGLLPRHHRPGHLRRHRG